MNTFINIEVYRRVETVDTRDLLTQVNMDIETFRT